MKVLVTHERFPPEFSGGGEYVVAGAARHLAERGVSVRVLTTGDPSLASFEGIPTARLPIHRYRMNLAFANVVAAARDVDLIQTFNYQACLPSFYAGRRLGKPVVCMVLGLFGNAWLEMKGRFAGTVIRRFERFVLTRPFDRTLFMSDYNLQLAVALGVDPARAMVVDPAIDVDRCWSAPQKDDVVLFAGKLDARKGLTALIEVARRLPSVRFQALGWGRDEALLREHCPANLEYLGFEHGDSFQGRFARARIFLLPSQAEGFPLVLAIAMASGCAVVSTLPLPFEGPRVAVGDIAGLAAQVERLWHDRAETARLGRANEQRARQYNWTRCTDTLLSTYERVLDERR